MLQASFMCKDKKCVIPSDNRLTISNDAKPKVLFP